VNPFIETVRVSTPAAHHDVKSEESAERFRRILVEHVPGDRIEGDRSTSLECKFVFCLGDPSWMPIEIPDLFGTLTGALHVNGGGGVSGMVRGIRLLRECEQATDIRC